MRKIAGGRCAAHHMPGFAESDPGLVKRDHGG
jgi:hypothetical protein